MLVSLLILFFLLEAFVCPVSSNESAAAAAAFTGPNGTLAPIPWKWTTCLGIHGISSFSLVGTYKNYAVAAGSKNQVYIVDLQNGTLIQNATLPLVPTLNGRFTLLPEDEILLQLGWENITAWKLPGLVKLWTADTLELGYGTIDVIISAKKGFFCVPVCPNGCGDISIPSCFRVADGSQLWTGIHNSSMSTRLPYGGWLVETDGILVVTIQKQVFRRPTVWTTTAIDVVSGIYLWSTHMTLAVVAADGVVVFSNQLNGSWGLNPRTQAVVWENPSLSLVNKVPSIIEGLLITPGGRAFSLANGSARWSIPSNASCSGVGIAFSTSSDPQPKSKMKGQYLCPSISNGELIYSIGNLNSGELLSTTELITPSGDWIFGSELGFYLFGVHPLEPTIAEYCVHSLPTNA